MIDKSNFVSQQDLSYIIPSRGLGTGLLYSLAYDALVACFLFYGFAFGCTGAFIYPKKNTLFNNSGMGLNIHGVAGCLA